ncbi:MULTISPECIES: type IV pilin [Halomicrobium]|nr:MULTISPECIES: type IV pilin [Halomicrobium]
MVAIVVLLVAAAGTFLFGLADQQTPAPTATARQQWSWSTGATKS